MPSDLGCRVAGRRRRCGAGRSTWRARSCLEPGREIDPEAPLCYCPNRPRPEIAARRLRVLYEDEHILIVDKPAGVLTQPTPERERDTLLERAGRYLMRSRGVKRPYVGIVHRIDRDTSGVVLLVCSPRALRPFQALFRAHSIERSYVAVVEGRSSSPRAARLTARWSSTGEMGAEGRLAAPARDRERSRITN